MVSSMTGFGRAIKSFDGLNITVEIKSVNHRYFEASVRMPRAYNFLEEKVISYCRERIARGKVEISISIEDTSAHGTVVELNEELANAYLSALSKAAKTHHLKNDIKVSNLLKINDMFSVRRQLTSEEVITNAVLETTEEAVQNFIAMRKVEGKRLYDDVLSRLDTILGVVAFIEERSPETVKEYRAKMEERIKELLEDVKVDEQRLLTETAIFADKVAVDEETVRLRSHISQLTELLKSDEAVGRKIDFIVQEMNRETNTIGSKAQDLEIAKRVVDVKAEIEKIREQIQNIE